MEMTQLLGTTTPTLRDFSRPLALAIENDTTTLWTGFGVVDVGFAVRHDGHGSGCGNNRLL